MVLTLKDQKAPTIAQTNQDAINASLTWLWQQVNGAEGVDPAFADEYNSRLQAIAQASSALLSEVAIYDTIADVLKAQLAEVQAHRQYLLGEGAARTVEESVNAIARMAAIEFDVKPEHAHFVLQALVGEGHDIPQFYREQLQEVMEGIIRFCRIEEGEDLD